jgi:DNA-3-methyladenine glycosylase II
VSAASVDWRGAAAHLRRADPALGPLIADHGLPNLSPTTRPVRYLTRAIVHQQLSGKAAETIFQRFLGLYPRRAFPTAEQILQTPDARMRQCGLSAAKAAAIKDLALHVSDGRLRPAQLMKADDARVAALLLPVRGIGPWSVDMFLMFGLARPDVLPVGDLGVRKGMQQHFSLRALPSPERMTALASRWRPYRTAGAWYMWRILESR